MNLNTLEFDIIYKKIEDNIKKMEENSVPMGESAAGGINIERLLRYEKVTVDPIVATKKRGLLGKLVVLFKRFSRKVVAWYLQPVCDAQTRYNHMVYMTLQNIYEEFTGYKEVQEKQQNMIKILEEQCKVMRDSKVSNDFWDKRTVSQAGEDAIISYILMVLGIDPQTESYLDLGANHAKELSNTYMLYTQGMRGVLVEANPRLIPELQYMRKGDIVLNRCIAEESGKALTFYVLNGVGVSSPVLEAVQKAMSCNPTLKIEETVDVESISVNEILEKYFTKAPIVLNIDIEGMEQEIIESINFDKFAPFIIIMERIDYDTKLVVGKRTDRIEEIMKGKGYVEYAFTGINSIFIHEKKLEEYQK